MSVINVFKESMVFCNLVKVVSPMLWPKLPIDSIQHRSQRSKSIHLDDNDFIFVNFILKDSTNLLIKFYFLQWKSTGGRRNRPPIL